MRLFISIPVSEKLRGYCQHMQNQFDELKKTNDFHLTLQFLGDGIEDSDKIQEALGQIKFEPFEIEMGDAVPFGPKHEPRGVWIECTENTALKNLAKGIQSYLAALGYHSDKPFRAHITLGRYKRTPKIVPKNIEGIKHRLEVNHFELMQSHLGESRPHYKILKEFFAIKGKDQ